MLRAVGGVVAVAFVGMLVVLTLAGNVLEGFELVGSVTSAIWSVVNPSARDTATDGDAPAVGIDSIRSGVRVDQLGVGGNPLPTGSNAYIFQQRSARGPVSERECLEAGGVPLRSIRETELLHEIAPTVFVARHLESGRLLLQIGFSERTAFPVLDAYDLKVCLFALY